MSTILFLSGQTMGDALGAIGRSFAPLFREYGHELVEVNFARPGAIDMLNAELQRGSVEFALTFMGMASDLAGKNADGHSVNLWMATGIPLISLFGDTPAYFFDRHVMPSPFCASFYAFPEHRDVRQTLPLVRGVLGVSPPGPLDAISRSSIDFRKKESGRLLFLKNGNDPAQLMAQWQKSLPMPIFTALLEVSSSLVSQIATLNGDDIDAQIRSYFSNKGLDLEGQPALRLLCIAQLDDYLRRVKSNLMAEVLMDFPIDMFGHNWEHLDFRGKRINFTSGGDYTKSGPMIRDSLGVIDMSPNTSRAPHERPLRAFGSYTLCLTNTQQFFFDNVAHAADFSFSFDKDDLRNKVADVIAHPARYVELGAATAQDFRDKFPSSRFVELWLEVAAGLRLARSGLAQPIQPYFAWPPQTLAV